jgi:formamidopyrimidine-DNA glycosylase
LAKADHVHVTWKLADQAGSPAGRLVFRDPRRFGGVWAFQGPDEGFEQRWASLGPDALAVSAAELSARLRTRRASGQTVRNVKSALLDQATIAGVGNIYADESLFRAGILPTRRVDCLSERDISALAEAIRQVMAEAIASGGSSLRDYVDGEGASGSFQVRHRVYGRSGLMCITCGTTLESGTVAQRTTVWCPACQH